MNDDKKWEAVISNNKEADGQFFFAVKSTGIFCRPSCSSREPNKKNVLYFDSREDAMTAGFRPCKRCRPDLDEYKPIAEIAEEIKEIIEKNFLDRQTLEEKLNSIGMSRQRMSQIFKQHYNKTITQYSNTLKLEAAKEMLKDSDKPVIDIAYSLGFESLSAFFTFFRKHTDMTPGEFRGIAEIPSMDTIFSLYETALGPVTITASDSAVEAVVFGNKIPEGTMDQKTELTDKTALQLEEYFKGKRTHFDFPIAPKGTEFQMKVWDALKKIPYGETRTYKEIAQAVGKPNAARAIGMANNKNKLMVLIPCHRVIGANGALVGYAGGIDIKEKLLKLEKNSNTKPGGVK
jgi:AraC family transcriptional regulator of adaptative response/methylated-DNA-[protein]-cysteine methyltransferase